jgi:hypothetical protein
MSKGGYGLFNPKPDDKPTTHRIEQHVCEVCGQRGSFGYGASYLRGIEGRWRCFSHRVETETEGEAA